LLHRWHSDELDCEISCVISNHNDLRSMVEWHGIPFYHVPVNPQDKEPAFAEVSRLVKQHDAEVVVLARYMQILPPELCREYAARSSTFTTASCRRSSVPSLTTRRPCVA
jgi:formyltetrahydrofolate deformylase